MRRRRRKYLVTYQIKGRGGNVRDEEVMKVEE